MRNLPGTIRVSSALPMRFRQCPDDAFQAATRRDSPPQPKQTGSNIAAG